MRAACDLLGLRVATEQIDALLRYLALLRRWNATYNLTAVRDPRAMVTQHLVDCLAAAAALERGRALGHGVRDGRVETSDGVQEIDAGKGDRGGRILDVGSGGGLPGVVLAILRPKESVTCIDAVAKKAAFVRQVAGALGLANLHAAHARVEAWRGDQPFDLITARAFGSLPDLVRLTVPLLKEKGVWMAMKGRVPTAEIAALPPDIEAFHVEPLTVPGLDAQRCLVWMQRRHDTVPDPTAPPAG
ncbi:MAG: 16S rRNA (guanine(527)-N(7))-methyltransferase RsmG [Burkholderiales bacterium]|nr:16S rRNA (guanine(527)-N(7))-methyltransferase RsmG [Burkholderiales bacterium]